MTSWGATAQKKEPGGIWGLLLPVAMIAVWGGVIYGVARKRGVVGPRSRRGARARELYYHPDGNVRVERVARFEIQPRDGGKMDECHVEALDRAFQDVWRDVDSSAPLGRRRRRRLVAATLERARAEIEACPRPADVTAR